MTKLISPQEVIQCVKQELDLADTKHEKPDISHLIPELKYAIVETMLLHTRGNQALAARILGISRCTLRKIYTNR
ncbi:TPA: helix-turn-helix domain-containing protein [Vibrio parahaemolyticus]